MALYGAAKAPAVMSAAGETVEPLTDNSTGTATQIVTDVGGAFNQTTLNDNFATLAAKIEELMTHMNDGRTA